MSRRIPIASRIWRDLRHVRRDELELEVVRLRRALAEGVRHEAEVAAAHRQELHQQSTEMLSVESQLESSRARLATFYDFAPVGYLILDDAGVVLDVSLTGAALLGLPRGDVEGRGLSTFAAERHLLVDHLDRCRRAAGGTVVAELDLAGRGGDPVPVELSSRIHREDDRPVIYTALRDIGERRGLEHALAQAVWAEQRRIAEALHDDLGQALTGMALMARSMEQRLGAAGDAAGAATARELLDALRDTQRRARDLARDLHPSVEVVAADKLSEALEDLATQAQRQLAVCCAVQVEEGVELEDAEVATQLYHVAREAVTNAARHGAPSSVTVAFGCDGPSWLLQVRDDGCGFDDTVQPSGLGTRLMVYRARRVRGELSVRSLPGEGTTVTCRVPRRWGEPGEPR